MTLNTPPVINPAPERTPVLSGDGTASPAYQQWFAAILKRIGGTAGRPVVGQVAIFEATIAAADLASAGTVAVLNVDALKSHQPGTGEQWKVRDLFLSGGGTNFSGGSGDRLLSITDGTSTWTVVPAATLQSLAAARWGDTGAPFPATAAHMTASSAADTNIVAQYSGGSNDYAAGSCTVILIAERVM